MRDGYESGSDLEYYKWCKGIPFTHYTCEGDWSWTNKRKMHVENEDSISSLCKDEKQLSRFSHERMKRKAFISLQMPFSITSIGGESYLIGW